MKKFVISPEPIATTLENAHLTGQAGIQSYEENGFDALLQMG